MPAVARSKTRRRKYAADARRHLATYTGTHLAYEGKPHENQAARVMALLWAQAFIEKALALETQGNMGDHYATGLTVARHYRDRQTIRETLK